MIKTTPTAQDMQPETLGEDARLGVLPFSPRLRQKIFEIARRLEALKEYNRDQAIFVAADIVRCRFLKPFQKDIRS